MIPHQSLAPGKGRVIWLLGEPRTFKITPSENGGVYLQFETAHLPGIGAPPHVHREEDEAYYVLASQYEFLVGDRHITGPSWCFCLCASWHSSRVYEYWQGAGGGCSSPLRQGLVTKASARAVEALTRQSEKQHAGTARHALPFPVLGRRGRRREYTCKLQVEGKRRKEYKWIPKQLRKNNSLRLHQNESLKRLHKKKN